LLLHDDLVPRAALHLDVNWISHPLVRQIVTQRLARRRMKPGKAWPRFWMSANRPKCGASSPKPSLKTASFESRQQLDDVTLKLRNQFLDRQIAASIQRASQPEISEPAAWSCCATAGVAAAKRTPLK